MSGLRSEAEVLFEAFHAGATTAEQALDAVLGLPHDEGWPGAEYAELQARHPGESVIGFATGYAQCRELFRELTHDGFGADDLFVDLGCGSGRLLLYGALTTGARFRGVELIEARVELGRKAATRLGLERVDMVHGNALEADLSDASIFYMYRPFSVETEQQMLDRLHGEARRRRITVVSNRLQPSCFDAQLFERRSLGTLLFHRTRASVIA